MAAAEDQESSPSAMGALKKGKLTPFGSSEPPAWGAASSLWAGGSVDKELGHRPSLSGDKTFCFRMYRSS